MRFETCEVQESSCLTSTLREGEKEGGRGGGREGGREGVKMGENEEGGREREWEG